LPELVVLSTFHGLWSTDLANLQKIGPSWSVL
jgi:hypothetical protein